MIPPVPQILLASSLLNTTTITSPTTAVTTRYWDCCKPSCAWPDKAQVSEPVRTCNKNDKWPTTGVDPNAASSCDGGDAYACSNLGPWAVNEDLAYGFAAAKLEGKGERDWCCACY
ncbi:hypothetical protein ACEPPN_011143, partial [Leptodophora sp. 'Broadleaf-Isolate-01']